MLAQPGSRAPRVLVLGRARAVMDAVLAELDAAGIDARGSVDPQMAAATGDAADLARKVVAGYIAYAYERVGEVTPTINGIDRIMGAGFNWAPPGLLVDTMGRESAAELITAAGLDVPAVLQSADGAQFTHPTMNPGKYFIAA